MKILYTLLGSILFFSATAQAQVQQAEVDTIPNPLVPFPKYDHRIGARIDSIGQQFGFQYNEIIHDEILKYETRKGEMGRMIGLSEHYFPMFEKALLSFNLPTELKYLPVVESSLNPLAISVSGAAGLWQFMPATGKGYGLHITNFEDQRHDPEMSSYAAAAYLRDMYAEFNDWLLTLAAYNTGAGTVRRAMQKYGVTNYWELRPYLSEQAQKYIPKFIGTMYMLEHANLLGVACKESVLDFQLDSLVLHSTLSFKQLSRVLEVPEDILHQLNPVYKRKIVQANSSDYKMVLVPKVPLSKYEEMYELFNSPVLYVGSKNVEQVTEGTIYTVVKGDNLTKIANRFGLSTQAIINHNNLKSQALRVGQKIVIPSSKSTELLAVK